MVAGLFLLGGCAVDQRKEVAQYRRVLDHVVAPTTLPDEVEPLTIERAMQLANQNNEQLGISGENYVQALINKNRIATSFLPTISLQPTFAFGQNPPNGIGVGSISGFNTTYRKHGDVLTQTQVPVVGSLNVFRGFADVLNLKAADAVIAQRRDLLMDLQQTVLLNVAQTYYEVLRAEQSTRVLESSLKLQEARLSDVRQQNVNGLATNLTVAQSRADVDATRVTLIRARTDAINARSTLAVLVGVHAVANPLVDNSSLPPEFSEQSVYEQQALNDRLDVRAAREALFAAREAVQVAIAQYYPTVTLNVTGFLYREYFNDASKWNALLGLSLPIFSAGQIEADVRTAWSFLRQAALEESETRRFALRDVQQAYQNLLSSRASVRELTDEVASAQDAYNQSRDAYRNGLAINLDVITAQDQLLNSELQLASARYDEVVFFLDLRRAVGVLPIWRPTPTPTTQSTTQPAAAPSAPIP